MINCLIPITVKVQLLYTIKTKDKIISVEKYKTVAIGEIFNADIINYI